jgi:hypothetical protein
VTCLARVDTRIPHAAGSAHIETMTLLCVFFFAEPVFLFAMQNQQTNEQRTIVKVFAFLNIIKPH